MPSDIPLIIEAEHLEELSKQENILLVDMCSPENYVRNHIPGAVFLEYAWVVSAEPPRMGLLPPTAQLENVLRAIGMTADTHVISYDDEGGGRACRFLWTLDVVGHKHFSLLNGGLHTWANEGHELTDRISNPVNSDYAVGEINTRAIADRDFILSHLQDKNTLILDTRSADEYRGVKVMAQRGGHIPGAVNLEWTQAMDKNRNLRLKTTEELEALLTPLGVTPDKEVVTYCQSHHRSAHTYMMLKSLGFEKVRGYAGSWSDWGNTPDMPID